MGIYIYFIMILALPVIAFLTKHRIVGIIFTIASVIGLLGFIMDNPMNAREGLAGFLFLIINLYLVFPIYIVGIVTWIVVTIVRKVRTNKHKVRK